MFASCSKKSEQNQQQDQIETQDQQLVSLPRDQEQQQVVDQNDQEQNGDQQNQQQTQVEPKKSPEQVVEEFYEWYLNDLEKCIGTDKTKECEDVYTSGMVTRNFLVNSRLSDFGGHYDPILCAQDFGFFDVSTSKKSTSSEEQAKLNVLHVDRKTGKIKEISTVELTKIDNEWKLDTVHCSRWDCSRDE